MMVVGRGWQHDDIEEVRGDGVRALSNRGSWAVNRTEEDVCDKAEMKRRKQRRKGQGDKHDKEKATRKKDRPGV
jgi:hypothetical protein